MTERIAAIERHRKLILDAERFIWAHPETGYRETQTSGYMAKAFEALGYKLTYAEGITGFVTVIDTGREGPEVMVLAELDSVICPEHPEADARTGAVHACGHNAQCAALLGVAAALRDEAVLAKLCGRVRLCVVPAEELLELEYRTELKKEGKIRHFVGKTEFLSRGLFDGAQLALMVHTSTGLAVGTGAVGCISKRVAFKGKAAHAGGSPWSGCNALYAAACGLNAVNAIRETFKDEDSVRVHPIITRGGDMVNAIPSVVTVESYVRGKTYEAIADANMKVNRALIGGSLSVGANVEITDTPGYAPLTNSDGMVDVAKQAATMAFPECECYDCGLSSGSTDMGDLSMIMPVVHPYCPGSSGTSHGRDYGITDPEAACVGSARWQLAMLFLLLGNNAECARRIVADYKPRFSSRDEYLAYVDSLCRDGERITYRDGGAEVVFDRSNGKKVQ